jgi:hypothetical protein
MGVKPHDALLVLIVAMRAKLRSTGTRLRNIAHHCARLRPTAPDLRSA